VSRTLQLLVVVALAAVVAGGAILLSSSGDDETPAAAPTQEGVTAAQEVERLYQGIPQKGIELGDPDAPATIVEIADLQCPFCAQYSVQALPTVVRDYVRPGKVNYELHIRSFLGRDSVRAAGAASAAAQENRMYQFADFFYRNQGPENTDYANADFIRSIAGQVPGLDVEKLVAAADDPVDEPGVREAEQFARQLGSTGTPDFYVRIKGRLQPLNPQGTSPDAYAAAIDKALAGT
jgi:protein-disulfide isomerase